MFRMIRLPDGMRQCSNCGSIIHPEELGCGCFLEYDEMATREKMVRRNVVNSHHDLLRRTENAMNRFRRED